MRGFAIGVALAVAVCGSAYAGVAVTSIGSGTTSQGNGEYGWRFTLNADITVTHLGVWDAGMDGLEQSATTVRLWSSAGEVIASATVPGGSAASLVDGFRYVEIDGVDLSADDGAFYVSATSFFSVSDPQAFFQANGAGLEVASPIDLEGGAAAFNPGQFPGGGQTSVAAYFGANFQFVPAPGAGAVLAMAGLGAARRGRR